MVVSDAKISGGLVELETASHLIRQRPLERRALLAAATPVWVAEHAAVEAGLGRDAEELRAGLRGMV